MTEYEMTPPYPEASHKRSAWAVLLIFSVVFLLTAAILFVTLPRLGQVFALKYGLAFADGYELIADNLVHGKGYRIQANAGETMMREPGYPLFLAAAFEIGGFGIDTVRWANLLLAIGIAFLLIRLAERVTGDRTTSLVAALLFLLYPSTLIAEARGGVEILFILVVLLFMLLLHRAVDNKGSLWHFFVAGLMLGVVVQVRSTPMVFPIFLLGYSLVFASTAKERLKAVLNITVLVTGMILIMTPWMVRNFRLVHHIVPTSTVQGVALQEGQYSCQHLTLDEDFYVVQNQAGRIRAAMATALGAPFEGNYYQVFFDPQDEWAFNKLLSQGAAKEYLNHPQLLAICACKNFFNFWFLGKSWTATWVNALVQIPLLVLAIAGIELSRRRGQLGRMGLVLIFVICIVAVHLPTIAHARHSVPLVPFLAIPASVSLISLWKKYGMNAQRQPA
jgi:4-amino-4-deoxy-L-arabinose transferase-like glycosyltransferase